MDKIKNYISPKLYNANGDLSKDWFVYFSFCNPKTGISKRFKVYSGLGKLKTENERNQYAEQLIEEINIKLSAGWDPFSEQKTYNEITKYNRNKKKENKSVDFSFNYFINKYINELQYQWRDGSFNSYNSKFRCFLKFLDVKYPKLKITQFTLETANEFVLYLLADRKLSNGTVMDYIGLFTRFFNDLIEKDIIIKNPFSKVKKLKVNQVGKKPFNDLQKTILKEEIAKCNPQLWLFIQFMVYTFIRPNELRLMVVGDIDIHDGKILVRREVSKNKKSQYVAIPTQLYKEIINSKMCDYPHDYYLFSLKGIPDVKPSYKDYFERKHRIILERLKFSPQHTIYSWKSTGVISAKEAGLDLKEIKEQLRHSSLDMTDKYLKSLGINDSKFKGRDYKI